MSNDKNPEVVGCDASIMKNVWDIREREYDQKMHLEKERLEKSALSSINQDWAARLAARVGGYKRVEAKPRERVEIKTEDIWKSKETTTTRKAPLPAPLGRPAGQSRSFSTAVPSSKEKRVPDKRVLDKRVPDKSHTRLQLLMSIGQSQPSTMVWGKSWKYNKCLPSPDPSSTIGWGPCWMFAGQQPFSEAGKPWPNGPNKMNPCSLQIWKKLDYRMIESLELELILSIEKWQMSWKKHDKTKQKGKPSENGENSNQFGLFSTLVESQHHNEALCSSEWNDSWRATKPANQDTSTLPNDDSESESNVHENEAKTYNNSKWEECWKFVNYHPSNNAKPQTKTSVQPEWVHSWRAAVHGFNNNKKSVGSGLNHNSDDDHRPQTVSHFHKIMSLSSEPKYKGQYVELHNELEALSEWSKSWLVTKNNSKPCEEIEKVIKESSPSKMPAFEAKNVENNKKVHHSSANKGDPFYEQLKHDILYQPQRKFAQSKLFLLQCMEKNYPSSEWRDSWKVIKHRMQMERQRRPLRDFRESQKEEDNKPNASEWKDSWRCPRNVMHQEPEMWQQPTMWPTIAPIRVDRARDQAHFTPVERPKNGPSGEPAWEESWRYFRRQPGQERQQISQERFDMVSHDPDHSQVQGRHFRSTSDWQPAWMVSETQFHHDNPSLIQWSQAWKCSNTHIQHWYAQLATVSRVDEMMEIQPLKRNISLHRAQAKLSQSFDKQMFGKRYPEKEWMLSWSVGPTLTHQTNNHGSAETLGKNTTQQQHANPTQNGLKWGKSFRIANPMPQSEPHWLESHPNTLSYSVMWRRGKKMPMPTPPNFSANAVTLKVWLSSHRLLQGACAHNNDKNKSKHHSDTRVIITKKDKTKKHLFSTIESEKQSERKWAGCHLLGKTQPRPKKSLGSDKKLKALEKEDNFSEEWSESWRFVVSSARPKSFKSLSGWQESWKMLLPPYPPMNGPKTR